LVKPNQISLPRNYGLMSYATFKESPNQWFGTDKVSISGARLLGASYGAATCNFRHTRSLLRVKASKIQKPS
jgi:hypothetical protein